MQIVARFALEVIANAALDMLKPSGHAENPLAAVPRLGPDRSALAGAVHDPVRNAAQRHHGARKKRRRLRQPAETRGDPGAMAMRKLLGIGERAARRHGENSFAVAWMNAQRVAPRAAMPPQPYRIDLRAMFDEKARGFGGPLIEESAGGHVSKSGQREIAGILPYPPPVKSLGAKTNHLPNIQGQALNTPPPEGVRNKNFGFEYLEISSLRSEVMLIP